jgi:hypothetical protein
MGKISELPELKAPQGGETVVIVDGGETKRVRWDKLVTGAAIAVLAPGLSGAMHVDADGYVLSSVDDFGDVQSTDSASGYAEVLAPVETPGFVDEDGYISTFGTEQEVAPSAGETVPPLSTVYRRVRHAVIYGQSNSIGWGAVPGLDRVPLNEGRALMFSGGIVPGAPYPPLSYLDAAVDLGPMVNLTGPAAGDRGAPGPRLASRLLNALPATDAVLVSSHGVGGQTYANLAKGTVPYAGIIRAMREAAKQCRASGRTYDVFALCYVGNEDNYGEPGAAYSEHLIELQSDVESDAQAISGRAGASVPMLLIQPSSWTYYGNRPSSSDLPRAQMNVMLAYPTKFGVVGPLYPYPHNDDGVHPTPESNRALDALLGRGLARVAAGGSPAGLYAASAMRAGTTVTVTCKVPDGNGLAIDTALVTNPGQLGLVYRDGAGNTVAISNIAVAGSTITLTLASAVPGTLGFGLEGVPGQKAGPTTGPRCCIRDTSADTAPDGSRLYNWMCHCAVAVA